MVAAVAFSLFTFVIIIFLSCLDDLNAQGGFDTDDEILGVGKKALGLRASNETNNGNSTLVKNKCLLALSGIVHHLTSFALVYLIMIIFLGLIIVVVIFVFLDELCRRTFTYIFALI